MVKHYLYCPMIPYLILNLGVRERITELMLEGKERHEKKLRKLRKEGWKVNLFLKSKYGINGYVDAVRKEDNGYAVLEIKNTEYRKRTVKMHLYQTACYAIMVEESFGRVSKIILSYTDKDVTFPFTLGIKKYCISIINKIKRIVLGELVSYRIDKKKCLNCGYFRFCKGI